MAFREPKAEELGAIAAGRIAGMEPMQLDTARGLSVILVGMEPWSRLGSTQDGLTKSMLTSAADQARSWCLKVDGQPAGVLVVHDDWLLGPYLKRLAVIPAFQKLQLAQAALAWWEADARQVRAANLWLCVSDFNTNARRVYEAAGFRQAGVLDDLVVAGHNEILMRKQLKPARAPLTAS